MPTKEQVAGTQSVLDALTGSIMGTKAAKAAKLTPVGTEAKSGIVPPTSFPYDDPQTMIEALRTARTEIEYVLKGIDAVLAAMGAAAPAAALVAELIDQTKAAERAADAAAALRAIAATETMDEAVEVVRDFNAEFAAKQKAAQAATFTQPPAVKTGWACPVHGQFIDKLSRKGRPFRGCPECDEFERLT